MELFFSQNIQGDILSLDTDESVHCVRVLRHREGDEIDVIDGEGNLMHCILLDADPKGASARILNTRKGFGAHPYRLTMAVCPTKNSDRFEWFAEKATEIGLDVLAPVIGEHSERKVLNTGRLERLVKSAAKQSLKGAVPRILQPQSVKEFIESAPCDALKMICYCFDGEKHSIQELLPTYKGDPAEIIILIGPEGDFSNAEAELALSRGWQPVSLGNSRLRTETAALVAVTMVYSSY